MTAVPAVSAPRGPAPSAAPAGPLAGGPAPSGDGGFASVLQRTALPAPASAAGSAPPAPGLAGRLVLDSALQELGRAPAGPGDGSGFVQQVFARVGVTVPAGAAGQARLGAPVASLASARSGDLVVFGDPPTQVAIYAGRSRVVQAPAGGGPVELVEISGPVTVRRIVDNPAPPAGVPAGLLGAIRADEANPLCDCSRHLTAAGTAPGALGAAAPAGRAPADLASVPFLPLFERAAAAHGLDTALLAAVARVESGFDVRAVSRAGAQGLMQFMPATAAAMGVNPWDPASAVDGAARYLREALDRFGRLDLALAAYNAGPGAVQRHGGIPPFPETQNYVRKVLEIREQYQR